MNPHLKAPPIDEPRRRGGRVVAILVYDGVNLADFAGLLDALGMASALSFEERGAHAYELVTVSLQGGLIQTSSGLRCETARIDQLHGAIDTLVVPGGGPLHSPICPGDVAEWIARRAPEIRRICSVCTGAFLLGAAGVLDDRRATTHFGSARLLQQRYPRIHVESEPIYVNDGSIWTSAGAAAAIDLALALIEQDIDHHLAMLVARNMVVFIRRSGQQPQLSKPLSAQSQADGSFAGLHAWICENLSADLTVERLAMQASMGVRTFMRKYTKSVGETPARSVESFRIEAARRALEESDVGLKQIAVQLGFGAEARFRRAFQRRYGQTPSEYRERAMGCGPSATNRCRQDVVHANMR